MPFAVPKTRTRYALDFGCGVPAYPPVGPDGYWRLRWVESDRRRETTAASHDEVVAKASDLVARLSQGRPTDLAQADGDVLVAHYLDPTRRRSGAGPGRLATVRGRRPIADAS